MPNYVFIGQSQLFYPNIITEHGSLVAAPGDVREFDNPPPDGNWTETEDAVTEIPFRPWPPLREPVKEAAPEPEPVAEATPAPDPQLPANPYAPTFP